MLASRSARSWLAATLLPGCLLLAGCSTLGATAGSTPAPATSTITATMAASSGDSGSSSGGGSVAQLPVLAQARTADNGYPLQVTVNRLKVEGQLLQLTFSVTNATNNRDANAWQPSSFFTNGMWDTEVNAFSLADAYTVDGVYLIDPKNAKRYLVARADSRLCVCTMTKEIKVAPGTTASFDATFKAPPQDVSTLTVVIPKTPAFTSVPVQR
jgi:hypothetical protein